MAHAIVVAKAAHQAIFKTSPRPLGASHVPPGSIKGRAHRLDAAAALQVPLIFLHLFLTSNFLARSRPILISLLLILIFA